LILDQQKEEDLELENELVLKNSCKKLSQRQERIVQKLVRSEFFENNSSVWVRSLMNKLRKHSSKEYWKLLKIVTKMNKSATIAVAFKQEENKETMSFRDYIEELYKKSHEWKPIPILKAEAA
jgi:Arc/MetJ-type ribon-helix-helix transcriptional regulator